MGSLTFIVCFVFGLRLSAHCQQAPSVLFFSFPPLLTLPRQACPACSLYVSTLLSPPHPQLFLSFLATVFNLFLYRLFLKACLGPSVAGFPSTSSTYHNTRGTRPTTSIKPCRIGSPCSSSNATRSCSER